MASHKTQLAIALIIVLILAAGCGRNRDEASDPQEDQSVAAANAAADDSADEPQASGDPAEGETLYQGTCSACHGPEAKGVEGLGKNLHSTESDFISSRTDQELVEFIKEGRQPDHPDNDTGVAMPPKGGNPALSEEDLYHIVAWLRTLE